MNTPFVWVKNELVWEYKHVAFDKPPTEEELNEIGKGGWELTGIVPHGDQTHFYFKRSNQ